MEIRNTITPEELNEMRAGAGWRKIPLTQAENALRHSMVNVGIYENNEIIAMGRLVGDGCFKAMLTDILVKPAHQKKGYGKLIIDEIIRHTKKNMHPNEQLCIEACPTDGNRQFYVRCGFNYDPSEQDGVSLWLTK